MPQVEFIGQVYKGKLTLATKKRFTDYVKSLEWKSKPAKVVLTIRRYRKKRTTGAPDQRSNQNGYLWNVMLPILADHFGYTPDEMYHALEIKFSRIGGTDLLPKIKKFKELDTKEWEEKLEKIRIWALTDYQINIPFPNEDLEQEMYETNPPKT